MTWFRENIWQKYYEERYDGEPEHIIEFTKKSEEEKYGYWDDETIPLIDKFLEITQVPEEMLEELLVYGEESWGMDLFFDGNANKRRKGLRYYVRLCQVRGTPLGFETLLRMTNLANLVFYEIDVHTFFENPLPEAKPNAWYEYEIRILGNLMTMLPEQVEALHRVSDWNEPINCKTKPSGFVYNLSHLPKDFAIFRFDNIPTFPLAKTDRNPNLFIENDRVQDFTASFDDETGDLSVSGNWESYYEFDDKYFEGLGGMYLRFPKSDAWLPFDSLLPENMTKNSFTAKWETKPDTVRYFLDVGTERGLTAPHTIEDGVIQNKVLSRFEVGNVTEFEVTGLTEDTVYFFQVWAERADGVQTYSSVGWAITQKTVGVPQNLQIISTTSVDMLLSWDAVSGATGYRIDVATDSDFTDFVHEKLPLGKVTNARVSVPNTGSFYIRLFARFHQIEGVSTLESLSESSLSTAITIL